MHDGNLHHIESGGQAWNQEGRQNYKEKNQRKNNEKGVM